MSMTLKQWMTPFPARLIGDGEVTLTAITDDSRKVKPGTLFVCVRGAGGRDGHDYAEMAVQAGASALVVERELDLPVPQVVVEESASLRGEMASRFYGDPSLVMTVIGITGTNGKTSNTYILEAMLQELGARPGVIGTVNYRFAGETRPAPTTTPGAMDLQALLFDMAQAGVSHVLMEVSSHALDQGRVDGVAFDVGVFTNLSQDHLDYHGNLEDYFQCKGLLFKRHLHQSPKPKTVAVFNVDDPRGQRLYDAHPGEKLAFSSEGLARAEVRCLEQRTDLSGISARVSLMGEERSLHSALPGDHNVKNLLSAAAVGLGLGYSVDEVLRSVTACRHIPGRLQRVAEVEPVVLVDYAHTPDSVARSLSAVRELNPDRLWVVLGCGGDRDKTKRPLMGEAAAKGADCVVLTSDNPRTEDPEAILDDIEPGLTELGWRRAVAGESPVAGVFARQVDRREAIRLAVSLAQAGDAVVIAGKGHEDYQIVGTVKTSFDDVAEAKAALAMREEAHG